MDQFVIFGLVLSILLGAVIGVERELPRSGIKMGGAIGFGGIRSYALVALFGSFNVWLDTIYKTSNTWVAVGALISGIFIVVSYIYSAFQKGQMGVTSEYAAILTYFIGVMAMKEYYILAVVMTIFIMVILSSKEYLAKILQKIGREELGTTLKFAVIAIVVLPLLQDVKYSFLDIATWISQNENLEWDHKVLLMKFFNPASVWKFVVVMSGIEYVAYILSKTAIGARGGILMSGILGGLISSTATTAAMTEKSHRKDGNTNAYVVGTLAASCVMFLRVLFIVVFYNPNILSTILLPGSIMFLALGGATFYYYHLAKMNQAVTLKNEQKYDSPFRIAPALKFAGLILLIKFIAGLGLLYKDVLSEKIFYYGLGLISGLADVDAITQEMSSKSADGSLGYFLATSTILFAVMSNNVVKATIAYKLGEKEFGKKVLYSFLGSILSGIIFILAINLVIPTSAAFIGK